MFNSHYLSKRKKNLSVAKCIENATVLINSQIEWIERIILAGQSVRNCPFKSEIENRKMLQWKGSPTDLVELLYALYEAGYFGKTPLKTLFTAASEFFCCEVKDYSRLFWSIRNRVKGERTALLDKLKKVLIKKMDEMDEKPSRK